MRKLLLALAAAVMLVTPALAAGLPEIASAIGTKEAEEALPRSARDVLGDAIVEDAMEPEAFLKRVWSAARENLRERAGRSVKSATAVLAAALICGMAGSLAEGSGEKYVTLGGVLAVGVIALADAGVFINSGAEALRELTDFSHGLLPTLVTAAAAGGAATSAAAKYAATALFIDVLLTAATTVVLPLIYAYIAASVAAAAMESEALTGAAGLMKWLTVTVMTLIMTAFTLYLTITGAVTGAADALAVKAAKTAISAALPVVGGIVSDAATTVVAGAGLLKNAVGAFGLVAVLAVCLAPFLTLGAAYLMYKAAAALSCAFAPKRVSALISSVGGAFGMVLSLVGAGALMLFISIISIIKAVSG